MASSLMQDIPISELVESEGSLRTCVKNESDYLGLVASIRKTGLRNPINVHQISEHQYAIIDGLQRYNACLDNGYTSMPCLITPLEDTDQVLEIQIMSNAHRIPTKPVEFARAMYRILERDSTLSQEEMAKKVAKTPRWVAQQLDLVKLGKEIAALVDGGEIKLIHAYQLAKLPPAEQANFVDRAKTMEAKEFVPLVLERCKTLRDARRKGKAADPERFVPVPMVRNRGEILTELEGSGNFSNLIAGLSHPQQIFNRALEWVLQIDPESVEIQKLKSAERRLEQKQKREHSRIERLRMKEERQSNIGTA